APPHHPRYLHSFPTRRSSDLEVRLSAPPPDWAKVIGALAPTVARLLAVVAELLVFAMLIAAAPAPLVVALRFVVLVVSCVVLPRSEEHTSELQSRFDLVCRLL